MEALWESIGGLREIGRSGGDTESSELPHFDRRSRASAKDLAAELLVLRRVLDHTTGVLQRPENAASMRFRNCRVPSGSRPDA